MPPDSPSSPSDQKAEPVVLQPSPAPGSPPAVDPVAGRMTAPPVVATAIVESSDTDAATNASIDALLGDHEPYQAAITSLQNAVAAGDAAAVAAMIDYPITVEIDGKKTAIVDEKSFVARYDALMTPAIANAITKTRYSDLMVNAKGIMFGNGEAWINGICNDAACAAFDVKLVALQPPPS